MNWVDIVAIIILVIGFSSGLKEGAVKTFFTILIMLIAIPTAGRFYYLAAVVLSFLPGKDWENFIGFFITLAIISIILHLIFFLPRHIAQKIWNAGGLYRLLGGAINLFGTGVSLVLLVLTLRAYPIINWAVQSVTNSRVLAWLVQVLSFVPAMLPEIFQKASATF